MQVVLVYLEWFWRNTLLKCVLQPKIAKNSLKTPILGAQDRLRSSMLGAAGNSSAHDRQQVCVYLQPFSHQMSQ